MPGGGFGRGRAMPRVNEEELILETFGAEVYEAATIFLSANVVGTCQMGEGERE